MNIGIAGVGKMGAAIAARLMEVGNQMTVWNRSPEKTKPLADAGAKIAATPADLAKAVDIVITILTDAAAIDATYPIRRVVLQDPNVNHSDGGTNSAGRAIIGSMTAITWPRGVSTHPFRTADQELIAEQRPQAHQRRTHGGLGYAKPLGRPRDVPFDQQHPQAYQEV